jgi:hypothetical protein
MKEYNEMPFIDYLNEVDEILEAEYGIPASEANMDTIASCQECNQSPQECTWEITNKYGIDKITGLYAK